MSHLFGPSPRQSQNFPPFQVYDDDYVGDDDYVDDDDDENQPQVAICCG